MAFFVYYVHISVVFLIGVCRSNLSIHKFTGTENEEKETAAAAVTYRFDYRSKAIQSPQCKSGESRRGASQNAIANSKHITFVYSLHERLPLLNVDKLHFCESQIFHLIDCPWAMFPNTLVHSL